MQLVGKKKFGKVKVKSMKGSLDNIPRTVATRGNSSTT